MTITEQRAALRSQARAIRDALGPDVIAVLTSAITDACISLLPGGATVALYQPIGSEIGFHVEALRDHGLRLTTPTMRDHSLVFVRWEADTLFAPRRFGIPEPIDTTDTIEIADHDALLVPALAVDRNGNRLGYGQGWYDRTFAYERPGLLVAGIPSACWLEQIPALPTRYPS